MDYLVFVFIVSFVILIGTWLLRTHIPSRRRYWPLWLNLLYLVLLLLVIDHFDPNSMEHHQLRGPFPGYDIAFLYGGIAGVVCAAIFTIFPVQSRK